MNQSNGVRFPLIEASVVIPTMNRVDSLLRCLQSFLSQEATGCFEVIVALDARDIGSQTCIIEKYRDQVTVVRAQRPGLNAARNKGAQVAKGELIIFIDDDCVIPWTAWILTVIALFKRYPHVTVMGGPFISENKASLFVRCRNRMSNAYVLDSMLSELESRVLLGGNMAYRRRVLLQFGFFDELLRYGATETELNERIVAGGGKLYFLNELSVVHAMKPRSLFEHCCQAFLQGRGLSYICAKNNNRVYTGRGMIATFHYMRVIVNDQPSLYEKAGAMIYIFLNSLSYKAGFIWGKIIKLCGVKDNCC